MSYTIADLEKWNNRIEERAREYGLDYYPQEFEIVNYEDMLAYEAYVGMPSRYPHWSFGKAYERLKTLYRYDLTGLSYEMVINSNPCIAYLMKDNTLLLQVLTIAHVYAHNDFFKNNRLFKEGTNANYTVEMFKNHAEKVRSYISDPSIGYEKVEALLNAAHAIRLQTNRAIGMKRISREEQKKRLLDEYREKTSSYNLIEGKKEIEPPDLSKIPLEPEDDILHFICEYGELEEWQKDVLEIVGEETRYFIPQIETKIMNEGWASYWHYKILKSLELPQDLYLEFLNRHNQVVAPIRGGINPYFLGFKIYCDLEKRFGIDKIFEARYLDRDQTFIRRYLTYDLIKELNLFEYQKEGNDYTITEVPDDKGWEKIRNTMSEMAGLGGVPYISVVEMSKKDRTLILEHIYDGRQLDLNYAQETLKYIVDIWGHKVVLKTIFGDKPKSMTCDEYKRISML